uniref:Uncharacterized protein n=1 Tax=Anguilla anguilla TaxID=7936 RepID=A0A0E9U3W9_ANGAN
MPFEMTKNNIHTIKEHKLLFDLRRYRK